MPFKLLIPRDLWRVLVFAAAARLSVHQACAQLEGAPSGPTVLGTLASQGSERDVLDGHLNDLLATLIPQGLGTRGRRVALDVVALPYHGDGSCARPAAHGSGAPHLRARLVTWGLRIQLLLLDRGFYRVRVIHDLLTGVWPFLSPPSNGRKRPPHQEDLLATRRWRPQNTATGLPIP